MDHIKNFWNDYSYTSAFILFFVGQVLYAGCGFAPGLLLCCLGGTLAQKAYKGIKWEHIPWASNIIISIIVTIIMSLILLGIK